MENLVTAFVCLRFSRYVGADSGANVEVNWHGFAPTEQHNSALAITAGVFLPAASIAFVILALALLMWKYYSRKGNAQQQGQQEGGEGDRDMESQQGQQESGEGDRDMESQQGQQEGGEGDGDMESSLNGAVPLLRQRSTSHGNTT